MLAKESLAQILNAGRHLRNSTLAEESLIELASIARSRNVKLEIVGNLAVESLVEIARAGGGHVLFDLSNK